MADFFDDSTTSPGHATDIGNIWHDTPVNPNFGFDDTAGIASLMGFPSAFDGLDSFGTSCGFDAFGTGFDSTDCGSGFDTFGGSTGFGSGMGSGFGI